MSGPVKHRPDCTEGRWEDTATLAAGFRTQRCTSCDARRIVPPVEQPGERTLSDGVRMAAAIGARLHLRAEELAALVKRGEFSPEIGKARLDELQSAQRMLEDVVRSETERLGR